MSSRVPTSDKIHRALSRSRTIVRLAVALRNQARCVIKHGLSDGSDSSRNGEAWLISLFGSSTECFIDVGANTGEWTRLALAATPRECKGVVFEPGQAALKILREKFKDEERVRVINCALGSEPGEEDFFEVPNAGTTSSLVSTKYVHGAASSRIRVSTLDAVFEHQSLPRSTILKIDTEGYDLHVMRGGIRLFGASAFALVQFEYNEMWAPAGS